MGYYDRSWDELTRQEKKQMIEKNPFPCFLQPERPSDCANCSEMACQVNTGFAEYEMLFPDLEELKKA